MGAAANVLGCAFISTVLKLMARDIPGIDVCAEDSYESEGA